MRYRMLCGWKRKNSVAAAVRHCNVSPTLRAPPDHARFTHPRAREERLDGNIKLDARLLERFQKGVKVLSSPACQGSDVSDKAE